MTELRDAARRKGSLWQTLSAVGWGFFGVRKRAGLDQDMSRINPLHLVIAGLVCAALFVAVLVWLVNWVIGSGIAAH